MVHITVFYLTGLGGLLSRRDVILTGIFFFYPYRPSWEITILPFQNCFTTQMGFIRPALLTVCRFMFQRVSSELAKTAFNSSAPDSWNRVSQRRYRRGDKPPEAFLLEKSITLEMAVVWHIPLPSPKKPIVGFVAAQTYQPIVYLHWRERTVEIRDNFSWFGAAVDGLLCRQGNGGHHAIMQRINNESEKVKEVGAWVGDM